MADEPDEHEGVEVTLAEVRALPRHTEYPQGGLIRWQDGEWLSRDDAEALVLRKLDARREAGGRRDGGSQGRPV